MARIKPYVVRSLGNNLQITVSCPIKIALWLRIRFFIALTLIRIAGLIVGINVIDERTDDE